MNRSSTAPAATAVSIFGKRSENGTASNVTVTLLARGSPLAFQASTTFWYGTISVSPQHIKKLIVTGSLLPAAGAAVAAGAAGAAVAWAGAGAAAVGSAAAGAA